MGYIYLITNIINNKKYIGQTIQKDINSRWKQHKCMSSKTIGKYLLSAYKCHGIFNFKFQIVCICFDSDIDNLEKYYIQKFNTLAPNGYNITNGGKHRYLSKKSKDKISDTLKHKAGKLCSEETKQKISLANMGKKNPNFGKKMTDEQRKKISKTMKSFRIPSDKQLIALKNGSVTNKKKVGKYDLEWNLLEIYPSVSEASKMTNICRSTISSVCRNIPHQNTAGGFNWKYIE